MNPSLNRNIRLALLILVLVVSVINTFLAALAGFLNVYKGVPLDWSRGTNNFLLAGLFMVITNLVMLALFRLYRRERVRA